MEFDITGLFQYIIRIMPQMMEGVKNSLLYYFGSIWMVIPIGVIFGILKASGPKPIRGLLGIYTWAWRGTPLLLQLMIATFGLRFLGIFIPDFWAVSIAFALNMSAYITEIMRAAIQSVDKGQYEACKALSIPRIRTIYRIIIPQSIRIAIPPACSEAINLVKDIALISIIGLQDITRVATQIGGRDKTFSPFIIAFLLYLFLSTFFVKLFAAIEKKVTSYD